MPEVEPVVASSERLVLTRWSDDDVEGLTRIFSGEVVRYLGGQPWRVSTARDSIRVWREIEDRIGITTWAVRSCESGELIGTCGFAGTNVPWMRFDFVIEIGWTLDRAWWGQGLATEAARAALDECLAHYRAERIVSKCHIDNRASEAVMQRIGMQRVGVVQGNWPDPTSLYRVV